MLMLKEQGFPEAAALLGGIASWKRAGYEVEGEGETVHEEPAA